MAEKISQARINEMNTILSNVISTRDQVRAGIAGGDELYGEVDGPAVERSCNSVVEQLGGAVRRAEAANAGG